MKKDYLTKKLSGFTLIEILVFIFIFTIVSLAFYRTMATGIQAALDSKNRLGALALANEKMEIARNLKYEDIGTVSGIPSGTLPENETIDANGTRYEVKNFVQFVDDSFDGLSPDDTIPDDYKRVKISVSWGSPASEAKEVSLVSRFVPPGLEAGSGDGVLSINIVNSAGAGIPQASVHIVNNDVSPAVNITQNTDNEGNLIFPGAQQSIQKYEITVSKGSDYETVSTVDPGNVNYFPIDVHASVIKWLLNPKSIVIDLLSDLEIKSLDWSGQPVPNVSYHLKGGRILGSKNLNVPTETVYILDADQTTDSDGRKIIANHSPGQFFLTNIGSVSGYTLVKVSPFSSYDASVSSYQFSLLPGTEKTIEVKFANNENNGLLVKVSAKNGGLPVNEAHVRLTNEDGFDSAQDTLTDGWAFFPKDNVLLVGGDYNLEVTAAGFQDYSSAVEIDKLVEQKVELIAS